MQEQTGVNCAWDHRDVTRPRVRGVTWRSRNGCIEGVNWECTVEASIDTGELLVAACVTFPAGGKPTDDMLSKMP